MRNPAKSIAALCLSSATVMAAAADGIREVTTSGASGLSPSRVEVINGKTHLRLPIKDVRKSPSAFEVNSDAQNGTLRYSIRPTESGLDYEFDREISEIMLTLGDQRALIQVKK